MKTIVTGIVVLAAICGLIFLEYTALKMGINGTLFSLVIAAIAGLGGFEIRQVRDLIKKGKDNAGR